MHGNMLKENSDKTEVIVFTTERKAGLVYDISVSDGDSDIKPSSRVRDQGIWFDSKMDMEWHVNSQAQNKAQ